MLSPRYLDGLSDEIIEIYSTLETEILRDMARRIARLGKITDATRWQAQMLAEAGGLKRNVGRILAKYDRAVARQVAETLADALETNARNDNRIFKAATGRTVSAPNAQQMLATIQKCHSDLSRLTLTTAATTQTQFVQEANRVYMNVQSGAFDYDTATKDAADALAKRGITTVQYENGKPVTRTIESAVRMNILTSVSQTAANMTLNNCEELDCDLVETSAHVGARPEHEEWQGQVFSRSGSSEKYRPFSVCGLGSPTGICGINCRHSFYPYFEGMGRHYTQDDLDEMAGEKVSFNGREMTRYEGEQKLRGMERNIRAYKRLALTEEAAGADSTKARRKLGEWQAAAREFTRQTGIARDSAREHVGTPTGKQPRGIALNSSDTVSKAQKKFPKDTFSKVSADIYASDERLRVAKANKNEKAKFDKEIAQAKMFKDSGHTIVLVSENSAGKNYDAIMDNGQSLELKTVTGSLSQIGKNFKDGIRKAENVFIHILSEQRKQDVFAKLKGEYIDLLKRDSVIKAKSVYIKIKDGVIYKLNISDLK